MCHLPTPIHYEMSNPDASITDASITKIVTLSAVNGIKQAVLLLLGFHPISNLTFPPVTQNFNLPGSDPNYVLKYSETYLGFSQTSAMKLF